MILKQDKFVKLCLELFHSSNLGNFHLEQRKSNQNLSIHLWNREKNSLRFIKFNGVERAKISISSMPALAQLFSWCVNDRIIFFSTLTSDASKRELDAHQVPDEVTVFPGKGTFSKPIFCTYPLKCVLLDSFCGLYY
jgi:hypothetical protein